MSDPINVALFELQDNLRRISETVEGEVTYLRGNGWTDQQARAIVATYLGWRFPHHEGESHEPHD